MYCSSTSAAMTTIKNGAADKIRLLPMKNGAFATRAERIIL